MRYGFIIDNRKCIGCHACTVACKAENHVPLTVNRTWVKYVGRYEDIFVDTNRSFAVYQRWKALTRPAPGSDGLRRPLWIPRVLRPQESAVYMNSTPEK